jgi:NAD(P)-dependent dehydrogenase (short-subunit alcohol dehydrogenase family)
MTDSLRGRTLLMSGGSRGIGLAIAARAARDGANIALLAKTGSPDPHLRGTIHTAAGELREAGAAEVLDLRRRRAPGRGRRGRSRRDRRAFRRRRHFGQNVSAITLQNPASSRPSAST